MAKVTFDVSGSDPDEATRAPEPPRPGVYKAKVAECVPGFKKKDNGQPDKTRPRLEVRYQIVGHCPKDEPVNLKHESVGSSVRDWLTFDESTQRRLDQFLQAVGVANRSKRKGSFDTDKVVGKVVKLRVRGDSYTPDGADEPVYSPKVGGVFAWDDAAGDDEGFDDGDGEDTPKKAGKAAKAAKKAAPKNEPSLAELGEAADNDDQEAAATLTEKAEEAGLDPEEYATWAELAEALGGEAGGDDEGDGDGDEEPEGEGDDGEAEDDLEALGTAADEDDGEAQARLTELAEENSLDPDEYPTWAELANAVNEALGGDPF